MFTRLRAAVSLFFIIRSISMATRDQQQQGQGLEEEGEGQTLLLWAQKDEGRQFTDEIKNVAEGLGQRCFRPPRLLDSFR